MVRDLYSSYHFTGQVNYFGLSIFFAPTSLFISNSYFGEKNLPISLTICKFKKQWPVTCWSLNRFNDQ